MKDISIVLERASSMENRYDAKYISRMVEQIPQVWCRLEDDSNFNWYLISKSNGKSVISYYGYLSSRFPVALLKGECPHEIYRQLSENGILIDEYSERYSCNENVLRRYVDDIVFIDDRFLYDESISFDEQAFSQIDEGIKYINPYSFTLEEIK